MGYINDSFSRMDLHQIGNFILYGIEDDAEDALPYRDILKNGSDPIYKRLDVLCPDVVERNKAATELSLALDAYEYVYMELGMKAGARLMHQLLLTDDRGLASKTRKTYAKEKLTQ